MSLRHRSPRTTPRRRSGGLTNSAVAVHVGVGRPRGQRYLDHVFRHARLAELFGLAGLLKRLVIAMTNGEIDDSGGDCYEDQEDGQARKHDPGAYVRARQPQIRAVKTTACGVSAGRVNPSCSEPARAAEQQDGGETESNAL